MMPNVSFANLVAVAAAAFLAPLLIGLLPWLRVPAVVVEIVLGIVAGPAVLGWVEPDLPVRVFALVGLAFLLFLAGLEIELQRLRGRLLGITALGFVLSFALALGAGHVLKVGGLVESPLLVAIILAATSLGVIIPLFKDLDLASTRFGQLVIAAASIADFATVILLTLFFSREATDIATKLVLLGGLALLAVALTTVLLRVQRSMRLSATLLRLQDTSAQIRVRGALLLLVAFAALAERLGVEVILGAFLAGATLTLVDRDAMMTHPRFRLKLEATGFGVFVPFFFVASGLRFDLSALVASPATLARVPVFLVALLLVRGLPALLYRPLVGARRTLAAGLLQATSLGFVVAASQIGVELGALGEASAAALVAAGLLSVIIFPPAALALLQRAEPAATNAPLPSGALPSYE